jgi:DNA mismatch repair protein MutL
MGKIFVLDENTANKIAAGEVIERPASVVKELLENSIDAGATVITVEIAKGGIALIKVTDNGNGIEQDDVRTAFERHATSKIRNAESLNTISTLGFRGEALASIAAVSKVVMVTRTAAAGYGTRIEIEGGRIKETGKTGCPEGTSISVRELFYNTPARYKFLKNNSTEARYVTDVVNKIALGNPQVSIRYFSDSVEILHTPGNNDLLSTIYCIYGKQTVDNCIRLEGENETMKVEGFIGFPSIARSNRAGQSFYVNGRYVKSPLLTSAADEAYKTFLMKGKHPFIVLKATTSFELVDVNVHPTKLQVRFYNEQEIFRLVYHSIRNALFNAPGIGNADLFKTVPQETYEDKATASGTRIDTADRRQVFSQERDQL